MALVGSTSLSEQMHTCFEHLKCSRLVVLDLDSIALCDNADARGPEEGLAGRSLRLAPQHVTEVHP